MQQRYIWSLVMLFAVLFFCMQLWLNLTTPEFADDESYHQARHLAYLVEHKQPMTHDPLSFGGRSTATNIYTYLLLPFAQLIGVEFAIKFVSALISALLIPFGYLTASLITKSSPAALLSSIGVALSPAIVTTTMNTGSNIGLSLLLITLVLYLTIKAAQSPFKQKWLFASAALVAYIIALTVNISSMLFLFGMLLFLLIMKTERSTIPRIYLEFWFIALVLSVWFTLLVYAPALVMHGWDVLYQNIPFELRAQHLLQENIFWLLASLGIVPCLAAVYAFFKEIHSPNLRGVIFVSMFGLAPLLLGVATVLSVQVASAYLALAASILLGPAYLHLKKYLAQLRIRFFHKHAFALATVLIISTLGVPFTVAVIQNAPQQSFDADTVAFLQTYDQDILVFVNPEYGHEVAYKTSKPVAMDTNFLLISDVQEKYRALQIIYTSILISDTVESLNKLGSSKQRIAVIVAENELPTAGDSCMHHVATTNNHIIYESDCEVIVRE